MRQGLAGLQWAVVVALVFLAVLTAADWARHRGRSRRWLAVAVGTLGLLGLLGRLGTPDGAARVLLTAVSLALLMASAHAFVLFRHSLLPMTQRAVRVYTAIVVVVTAAGVAANLDPSVLVATGVPLVIDLVLLLSWCALVGASIIRLWRVSGALPSVQRARLRALNAGFGGIVIALLATALSAVVAQSLLFQVVVECIVLLSMPLLGLALSPPGWVRRVWREREEVQLRLAINNLLLYSPDEATLALRALEWAGRLLGGRAALIALDGRVVAVEGLSADQAETLHQELEQERDTGRRSFTSSAGPTALVPLHAQSGEGYLTVLAGPFTPLFGEEEVNRLAQYAVSITVALDRVYLVAGVQRNAELLDLAYDAVFSWDFRTRGIEYWNRAATELYGFTVDEVVGRDPQPLLRSQYPEPLDSIVAALVEHGHWEGELEQSTKDGRTLPISARWALQRDSAGAPLAVLEINRDISADKRTANELRKARDAAEHASTAKSEYLSRMSHELRTPLAAMLGFSDLLELRDPREDQMQAIEAIQRAGSHLLSMVNDVLDIARIESGRETLSLQPVDVQAIVRECIELVQQSALARRVNLVTDVGGARDVFVRADRQRLAQVVLNLLTNAIKYGDAGGRVVVAATATETDAAISVSDDGPGIDPDEQGRLFQPFERLGAERSHVQGTGLGLALSRQLTAAMGGTVEVRSAKGEGATFTVRLQRAARTEQATVIPASGPAILRDRVAEHTVLYVEDNLATIGLVESIFALRPALRLVTAMQGSLAVDLAREHQPDLIILDLHLPDLNGDEVMRRLRSEPRTMHIPIVIYSADATDRQVARLLAEGAHAYMTKPARVSEFLAMLDRVLMTPAELRRTRG